MFWPLIQDSVKSIAVFLFTLRHSSKPLCVSWVLFRPALAYRLNSPQTIHQNCMDELCLAGRTKQRTLICLFTVGCSSLSHLLVGMDLPYLGSTSPKKQKWQWKTQLKALSIPVYSSTHSFYCLVLFCIAEQVMAMYYIYLFLSLLGSSFKALVKWPLLAICVREQSEICGVDGYKYHWGHMVWRWTVKPLILASCTLYWPLWSI